MTTSLPQSSGRTDHLAASTVSEFLDAVARKLGRGGSPEDQLRSPLELAVERIGRRFGLDPVSYGEVRLKELRARPDYAVDVGGSRVGYIELKAPGRGIPPAWRPSRREREQWEKLCSLPNVIYTDGTSWGRYCYGVPDEPILRLDDADVDLAETAFEQLIRNFLIWNPDPPRSLVDLVRIVARLCGLLRDEVVAMLASGSDHVAHEDLTLLAADWRDLLFPDLNDADFGDAYAQTIAFAMLLARIGGIALDGTPLHEVGRQIAKKHTLIGRAFSILIDSDATDELTTIDTLRRVIGAVDWAALDDGHTDVYAELYENFLAAYNPDRRKDSGSYYTPQPVARFMVAFADEILRERLERPWGFADENVVVVDPAMGTGTFLVEVIQRVADTVDAKQGAGSRPDRLRELFRQRLVGFERQVAPYAVAELRLHEALKVRFDTDIPASDVRFLTNTLENPHQEQLRLAAAYKVIERSREEANRIKRERRVMVAIGNPPHVGDAKRQVAWLNQERRFGVWQHPDPLNPSIDDFRIPGLGKYDSDLHALQWYFWRWALWKVFDAHPDHPAGVVAFLTPTSYTTGKAFAGMREYIRRTCEEGWIIDLSPEGNRPKVSTRIFGTRVQRCLSIGVFARYGSGDRERPAIIHHIVLRGTRGQKLDRLRTIDLADPTWEACQDGWQDPFLPAQTPEWGLYPRLADLMPWRSRGVTAGRSWIYAPDTATLMRRWQKFILADVDRRKALLPERRDRKLSSRVGPLPGFPRPAGPLSAEYGDCLPPVRVAYRSFDRQWVIPDNRLMAVARPPLWAVRSDHQIYVSEQDVHPIESGPGLVFSALIPDIDHFNVRGGGVRPLFRDANGSEVNIAPGLTLYLSQRLGIGVLVEELLAYIAAIVAHPAYTARFRHELRQPGIRIPLTADPELWREAVACGCEIVWLHTFGERFVDPSAGRPFGALALTEVSGVKNTTPIVAHPPGVPDVVTYYAESRVIRVGDGAIGPVEPAVWNYDVGGMRVVRHWFDYRSRKPLYKKNKNGLDGINITSWNSQLTDDFLATIAVLKGCVDLEQRQADLLARVCDGPLISFADLGRAGLLPAPEWATNPPRLQDHNTLFSPDL